MTCNEARSPFIRTHDELKTALNPHVVGDDDADGELPSGKASLFSFPSLSPTSNPGRTRLNCHLLADPLASNFPQP